VEPAARGLKMRVAIFLEPLYKSEAVVKVLLNLMVSESAVVKFWEKGLVKLADWNWRMAGLY